MSLSPQFGIFLIPTVSDPQEPFRLARIADSQGLDLLTIQDHPYQRRYYETWTLLTALAVSTERIHVSQNVANLPLRLPSIIAKQAASLDILSGGRVEIGLGAGGFWDAIAAYGGPRREPGQAYAAFQDALHIIRGMWDDKNRSFTYEGEIYSVKGAKPGPFPAHDIPIWVGATGPRMLRLTGRMADGILVSMPYVPPEKLARINRLIDEGAEQANRSSEAIRRGYNIGGVITSAPGNEGRITEKGNIEGTAAYWVEQIGRFYSELHMDTFILWSSADNVGQQYEIFAKEVVPAVKEQVGP